MERFDYCECGKALTVGTYYEQDCQACPNPDNKEEAEYWSERTKLLIKIRNDENSRKTIAREQWFAR